MVFIESIASGVRHEYHLYPSDELCDRYGGPEWEMIAPYINHDPKIGSPRDICMRCVMNALLYIDRTGCQWNLLPKDVPKYGTVY